MKENPPRTILTAKQFSKSIGLDKLQLDVLALPLMKLLRIADLNKVYANTDSLQGSAFIESILAQLHIRYDLPPDELDNLPKQGAFITVSNHPYGGIDGLLLLLLARKVRPDFRVLANYLLQNIEPLRDCFIAVNPFEESSNRQMNISGMKTVLGALKNGEAVGIFPAGEVSALRAVGGRVTDKQWETTVGKLIQKANVPIVPIYFSGKNSPLFNLLGIVHPRLRTARLPSELLNKRAVKPITVRIGKPIQPNELSQFTEPDDLLDYLRSKTYALGSPLRKKRRWFAKPLRFKRKPRPVVESTPTATLAKEVEQLRPTEALLLSHGTMEVYIARADQIINLLREIGRLRELTFRAVGEGTNRAIDLDTYDLHYLHLFLWDAAKQQVAGAYRIGPGDQLFAESGKKGFYISELFRLKKGFVPVLKQSLELGRSFVAQSYQRKPTSLLLLWKGLWQYVRQHPEYRYLIGPVSISNDFSRLSKELLVAYVQTHYWNDDLAQFVRPRKRFRFPLRSDANELLQTVKDLKALDSLIAEIEFSHNKIPVLLKKYLSQQAKIVGFNVDPKFSHVLDGLVVLDVQAVPDQTVALLDRYA